MSANLLVELFTEELPPKALKRWADAFAAGDCRRAGRARTGQGRRQPAAYIATPRRLAVKIDGVLASGG